jgi:hypothetical protein
VKEISHASTMAQGTVVWAKSASYGKSVKSVLRRNQTPWHTTTKISMIDNVANLNKRVNVHCNQLDKGAPTQTLNIKMEYNDFVPLSCAISFSRNRVAIKPSVAQTCMMAHTKRFDAFSGLRWCAFRLRDLEFPTTPIISAPMAISSQNENVENYQLKQSFLSSVHENALCVITCVPLIDFSEHSLLHKGFNELTEWTPNSVATNMHWWHCIVYERH